MRVEFDSYLKDIYLLDMFVGRTSTVESLLGMLSFCPMSGYEMRQLMERSTANFWTESFGQIYPALKQMLAAGLVEVEEKPGEGHPTKKVYRMTAAGSEHLRAWLKVPAVRRPNRNELLLKLFFGSEVEYGAMARQIEGWRAMYAEDMERYLELERQLPTEQVGNPGLPYFLMTVRYGIAEAKALLGWADETLLELGKAGIRDKG